MTSDANLTNWGFQHPTARDIITNYKKKDLQLNLINTRYLCQGCGVFTNNPRRIRLYNGKGRFYCAECVRKFYEG